MEGSLILSSRKIGQSLKCLNMSEIWYFLSNKALFKKARDNKLEYILWELIDISNLIADESNSLDNIRCILLDMRDGK